jgi:hypothetical protein
VSVAAAYHAAALAVVIALTVPSTAHAQQSSTIQNQPAATLQSAQSAFSGEKRRRWLREKFHMSVSAQWPINFPVPVYTSNVVQTTFSNSTQGQPRAAATLLTRDAPKQVFDFYQSALSRANWTLRVPSPKARTDMNIGEDFYFLNADQGKQSIYLTCLFNPKSNITFVTINWQKNL